MKMVNYYIKILIIFIFTYKTRANKFIVVASEKSFFQPCDITDNNGNTNLDDMAEFNVKHEYADDMETLVTNGNVTIKIDIPVDMPVELELEFFEWKRGKWEQTVYSIRRPDICKVLFDPSELWYAITMQIPEEDRACPPEAGTVYHIKDLQNRIELPDIFGIDLEGKYKTVVHFIADEFSTCISTTVNIWKD